MKFLELTRPKNIDTALTNLSNTYVIDSEIFRGLHYGVCSEGIAIFKGKEVIIEKLEDVPKLAEELIPEAREELLEFYHDVIDLGIARGARCNFGVQAQLDWKKGADLR